MLILFRPTITYQLFFYMKIFAPRTRKKGVCRQEYTLTVFDWRQNARFDTVLAKNIL